MDYTYELMLKTSGSTVVGAIRGKTCTMHKKDAYVVLARRLSCTNTFKLGHEFPIPINIFVLYFLSNS